MKKVIGQGIRHILVGAVADLADIGFFNLLFFVFPFQISVKAVSFLIASAIKYVGNKYWAFSATEEKINKKEISVFLVVTLVGLVINVAVFSVFVKMNAGIDVSLWRQISVILAMLITAVWNFCGYKFIVFKK